MGLQSIRKKAAIEQKSNFSSIFFARQGGQACVKRWIRFITLIFGVLKTQTDLGLRIFKVFMPDNLWHEPTLQPSANDFAVIAGAWG